MNEDVVNVVAHDRRHHRVTAPAAAKAAVVAARLHAVATAVDAIAARTRRHQAVAAVAAALAIGHNHRPDVVAVAVRILRAAHDRVVRSSDADLAPIRDPEAQVAVDRRLLNVDYDR